MLNISEIDNFDEIKILSDKEAELILGGNGLGVLTAITRGGETGIVVALGNGACDTPSQCGQTSSALGAEIGGGKITALAAKQP